MKRPHVLDSFRIGGRQQRFRNVEAAAERLTPTLSASSSSGANHSPTPTYVFGECDSELAAHLLKLWSWGRLSAVRVQEISSKSHHDQKTLLVSLGLSPDLAHRSLAKLSKLGGEGKYPNHCHSELITFLGEPSMPKPLFHDIPMLLAKKRNKIVENEEDGEVEQQEQTRKYPILLPHLVFSHYYSVDKNRFKNLFLGDCDTLDKIEEFWTELETRGDPRLKSHPMCRQKDWKKKMIPFSFHGDGVPVLQVGKSNSKTVDVYSIQSIFNKTVNSMSSKILVALIFTANRCSGTEDELWRVLIWSFHWMFMGKWPPVDWNFNPYPPGSSEASLAGQDLAGGYCGVLFTIKADLDFLAKTLGLRHYNSKTPCELCPAHRDTNDKKMLYNNFSADASWMKSLYDIKDWRSLYPEVPHPIFLVLGVNHYSVEPDELHIIYLGTAQYLLGSVLYVLVFKVLGESASENMTKVWNVVCDYYKMNQVSVQYSSIQISSFCNPKNPGDHYPRLKGKGAEVKDLVAPLSTAWDMLVPDDFPQKASIQSILRHQIQAQEILHEFRDELFLPIDKSICLRNHINQLCLQYQRLAVKADKDADLLWSQPTKWHWLWHLAERSRYLNPRRSNTMIDEDYVGRIKDLVHACASGTDMDEMAVKAIEKYRYGFDFLAPGR